MSHQPCNQGRAEAVCRNEATALIPHNLEEWQSIRDSYLELMQSFLTGVICRDLPLIPSGSETFDLELRENGLDWPSQAFTMIGVKRLNNLRILTESIIEDKVPGDLIETGVWRGGACILMRAVLYAHNITDRTVWVADSFAGLPPANAEQYPEDAGSEFHKYEELAVSLEEVKENFRFFDLLDEQTKFLKGWFKDTLPTANIGKLALLRLDGDMYESTMDALNALYPKLSPNGYIIIDDYHVVPECKAAVSDYCRTRGIEPKIVEIDGVGVYWRKPLEGKKKSEHSVRFQVEEPSNESILHLYKSMVQLSQNAIIRLNQAIAERDCRVVEPNQHQVKNDRRVSELKQLLAERDRQIEVLNQTVAEQEDEVMRLNQALAEKNIYIAEILSSTSWRISYPVRFLKNILRRVKCI